MSSSSFLGNRGEVNSYQTVAAPASLASNDSPSSMKGSVRQASIASSSGDQSSGGLILFNIPAQNASITRKTMFVRARVQLAYSAALPTYTASANSTFFQGPGPLVTCESLGGTAYPTLPVYGGTQPVSVIPQLANAYALILRSTVFSGGQVLDQVNQCADFMSGLVLPHSTNRDWLTNDGTSLIAVAQCGIPQAATASNLYWDVTIPVVHSMFNSERDYPLYLLGPGTPLSIQIDLNAILRVFKLNTAGGTAPNNFTVSQASLVYEAIDLPGEFVDSMRSQTKSTPFILPQLSYMITQLPMSALASYTVGVNCSSIRGVYVVPFSAATFSTDPTVSFAYNRNGASDVAITATVGNYSTTNYQVFADGRLINSVNLDNPALTFAMLKQALNGSISNPLLPSLATRESYKQFYFALGLDTTVFGDASTVLGGTPASQLTIALTNFQANPTFIATVIIAYDSLLVFKDGMVEVKR